jgi:phosphohistidine phosphatase SixA
MRRSRVVVAIVCVGGMALALGTAVAAQTLSGNALVSALRKGGYVIVMRHAASPREVPDKASANPDNTKLERQLDAAGRSTSIAMGKAVRDLKVPVGDVFSSPTYRAVETVKYAELGQAKPVPDLGDGGQSMQAAGDAQGGWLQKKVTEFPTGRNTVLVTHMPNITRAFPGMTGVADGEALVFGPDGKGGATLVGRIKIEEWPTLK